MGIKGLESYMESNLSGKVCYSVSIEKIVQQFAETNCCSPLILIDAPSTLRFLIEGLDWICGGQYSEYQQKVVSFVSAIRKCGAEPVFFFDGPCQVQKREEWVKRRVENYYRIQLLMERIRKNESVAEVGAFLLPTGISMFERYVLTEICRCKVVVSAKECDEEIAAYAKSQANVVAVMAQDSDFLIYNAAPYYLSAKHLDVTNLSTKVYSSSEFAKVHKLDARWLPVLGTLLGNDYLSLDVLRKFHLRLTNWRRSGFPRHHILIPAVSKFICDHLRLDMSVQVMAEVLAPHLTDNKKNRSLTEQLVCNALRSFLLMNCDSGITDNPPESYGEKLLFQLRKDSNFSAMAAQVLVHRCVEHSNALEDLTSQFKASVLVYRALHSRYIGLLLNHEHSSLGESFCMDEYSVHSEHSVKRIQKVKVSFPPFKVDLLSMCCSDDPASRSSKLRTLLWTVTGNDQSQHCYHSELERRFLRVDPKLFICALVLFYLHKVERVLMMPEVELFICLFVHLDSISQHQQQHPGVCEVRARPNYNAVHLATLFNRGIQAVSRVVSALGPLFPSFSFAHSNFFDGVLFQKIFLREVVPSFDCDRALTIKSAILDFINCS